MLVSDFKSQSKMSKSRPKSKGGKESSGFQYDDDDDEMMSEGVSTKKNMAKMFEDMEDS